MNNSPNYLKSKNIFSKKKYKISGTPKDNKNVYVFENENESSTEELELTNIRQRNTIKSDNHDRASKKLKASSECVIHTIKENDTLQGISLLYEVPIGEIKRVNNLISNQDFYGLQKLKIPTKKYGMLLELLPTESTSKQETRTISISHYIQSDNEAANFLKRMDQDLSRIRNATKLQKDSLEEVTSTLTMPHIQPLVTTEETSNWGIQWQALVLILVLICVVGPLVGVFYLVMNRPNHNETPSSFL